MPLMSQWLGSNSYHRIKYLSSFSQLNKGKRCGPVTGQNVRPVLATSSHGSGSATLRLSHLPYFFSSSLYLSRVFSTSPKFPLISFLLTPCPQLLRRSSSSPRKTWRGTPSWPREASRRCKQPHNCCERGPRPSSTTCRDAPDAW